ncbi:MAG: histidine kinase N-terminal 7TM domain-containing protein [Halapricum sp.]
MLSQTIIRATLIVTVAAGATGGILAWREQPKPGSVPLAILLAGQCWWSVTLFFRISATSISEKVFWMDVTWFGVAILPVAWLFFSLSYTGYAQYLKPRYVALVSIVPIVTILLGITNETHQLLYLDSTLIEVNGGQVLTRTPGVWYWVIAAYTYALGFFGAVPLLQFVTSRVNMFRGQSLAILFGLTIPWVTNALYLVGVLPTGGTDPTPVAFSLSALSFLAALTRFQLFETSPTPIKSARQMAFERMDSGVLVLDPQDNVVKINKQAEDVIGSGSDETLGRPVDTVLPETGAITNGSSDPDHLVVEMDSGTAAYDVSVNRITDDIGRETGKIVSLHDISEYLRQQQRLKVLNRVFRHNVRTNTQIIVGQAEHLTDQDNDTQAEKIQHNALEIKEFSDKIRTIIEMFDREIDDTQTVPVEGLIQGTVELLRDTYPNVSIHIEISSDISSLLVDGRLEQILRNVLDNAARHNTNPDPQVRVEVTRRDDRLQIAVADNGPGIDEEELVLLDEGTETPLKHGSGLGLALIVWGVDIIGGDVTFEPNEPSGVVVILSVPVYTDSTDA